MPARPRSDRVAGCSGQLLRPWCPWPRVHHRTDAWAQGGSWLAQLFGFSFAHIELQRVAGGPILNANSAGTLEGRSAHSVSFSGHKGLLLASHHSFPQFPQKYWGKLDVADSLNKGSLLLLQHYTYRRSSPSSSVFSLLHSSLSLSVGTR